ncbi:MAG: class I SAM-dependent methyltransferase [Planctomycetes bacterium]|nr:class I SAM-dependent methyltransferase [Planctomycetota bacterium]
MQGYDEASKLYRDVTRGDEEAAVRFLEQQAAGGPALELGIGAGRIALPLAARGIRVDGIDISPSTVAQMRTKPGGASISVVIGDMAEAPIEGAYRLIYVVWNSFFNLPSQEAQVRCFKHVASRLASGGKFVVEAYMPSFLYRLRNDQYVDAEGISLNEVRLDVLRHDAAKQRLEESHVSITKAGIELSPVVQRYAWPSELDLMAQLAGLRTHERWGGWNREPFQSSSETHISVFGP